MCSTLEAPPKNDTAYVDFKSLISCTSALARMVTKISPIPLTFVRQEFEVRVEPISVTDLVYTKLDENQIYSTHSIKY